VYAGKKTLFIEKFMHGKRQGMADAKHRAEGIGTKTQVCFFPQKFKAVFFGLQRIFSASLSPRISTSSAFTSTFCPLPNDSINVPVTFSEAEVVMRFRKHRHTYPAPSLPAGYYW
jgi:hypothetical protein